MKFGKIDYLNLLPFHVFLKRAPLQNAFKKGIEMKKGVPSKLCDDLRARRIDAAVISSIEARRYKKLNMGICAKKQVISVLVRKNTNAKKDTESRTSNMLSRILGLSGEVIIGDKALKAYLECGKDDFYDLGNEWNKRTNLPFVFGQFACVSGEKVYKKLVRSFLKRKIFIPRYILETYSKSRKISQSDILWYLKYIHYEMKTKEQKALKMFISRARTLSFKA